MLPFCLVACQAPPTTPMPPVDAGVCEALAYVFRLIGENKDRGLTQEEQVQMAYEGVGTPFATQPARTLRNWEKMIELVYRQQDRDALEIEAQALGSCAVNSQGQAVLVWPKH